MDKLIEQLQSTKSYKVTEIGEETKTNEITNYRAINTKHDEPAAIKEISTADLVSKPQGATILRPCSKLSRSPVQSAPMFSSSSPLSLAKLSTPAKKTLPHLLSSPART